MAFLLPILAVPEVDHSGDPLSRLATDRVLAAKVCQYGGVVGKEPEIGPTARAVADNVREFREAAGWNFTELSERLASEANWSINAVGIRRIEQGERRVTPDDLAALAVALGVSPVSLLMPKLRTVGTNDEIEFTGLRSPVRAEVGWLWLTAQDLPTPDAHPTPSAARFLAFLERACPPWVSVELADRWRADIKKLRQDAQRNLIEAGWVDESEVANGDD
ncbi:helix-turn-helix domain-containing protein [Mycolicibacterium austroafricanum]|uniref:helix-turn-helix domain-containing protein n=1 Tax=Mycolicibacterium austroafricanum TaxID=39687 RepID=UPI000A068778|nr:helix-turn-helix transcriptional regulator [Mycolicibacterium austroafricanum]QZY46219.1 helix-turn-helix domain-containing protein [Mycolicibacterium austroafricanum]